MVRISELRVGNILKVDGNLWHVESIIGGKNPELYFVENDDYDHYLNAEPISLTPEIMKASGFGNGDTPFFYESERGVFMDDGTDLPHVKYLHQVQNLYHALTGQELTVNLPQTQAA